MAKAVCVSVRLEDGLFNSHVKRPVTLDLKSRKHDLPMMIIDLGFEYKSSCLVILPVIVGHRSSPSLASRK